ncbi:MAG: nucleotidyltransferase substrate binding protein, partial [Gammaproteobacteria bacterium]
MTLDLTPLADAIASFEEGLAVVSNDNWFNSQTEAVRNTLIAGVIQNFEFVYELGIKMIRRRIELDAATPAEADFADFRDLLR